MKIKIAYLILLLLAACSPQSATPTVSSSPTVIVLSSFTETPNPTPTMPVVKSTPSSIPILPVKEYLTCTPEKFRDCVIPLDDLYPQNGAATGEYDRWRATKMRPFEEGKTDLRVWNMNDSRMLLMPDTETKRLPGTISVWKDTDWAITEPDEGGFQYQIIPLEFPDPSDPYNAESNIRVTGFKILNYVKNGVFGKVMQGGEITYDIDVVVNKMGIAPIVADFKYPTTDVEIPLAVRTWEEIGQEKMTEMLNRVANGDVAALKELKGMPIMIVDGDTPAWH